MIIGNFIGIINILTKCDIWNKHIEKQVYFIDNEDIFNNNDNFDKLYNLNSLEDNNTLEEIFNDMYSCLPEKVGDRSIMPILVMFPTSKYITNLKFKET